MVIDLEPAVRFDRDTDDVRINAHVTDMSLGMAIKTRGCCPFLLPAATIFLASWLPAASGEVHPSTST